MVNILPNGTIVQLSSLDRIDAWTRRGVIIGHTVITRQNVKTLVFCYIVELDHGFFSGDDKASTYVSVLVVHPDSLTVIA